MPSPDPGCRCTLPWVSFADVGRSDPGPVADPSACWSAVRGPPRPSSATSPSPSRPGTAAPGRHLVEHHSEGEMGNAGFGHGSPAVQLAAPGGIQGRFKKIEHMETIYPGKFSAVTGNKSMT